MWRWIAAEIFSAETPFICYQLSNFENVTPQILNIPRYTTSYFLFDFFPVLNYESFKKEEEEEEEEEEEAATLLEWL